MAKYHKNLKYHEDTVKKHGIAEEELDFLIRLQKEMNTQDTVHQADPRFWVIKGTEERIAGEGYEYSCTLFNNQEAETVAGTMQEAYEYIKEKDFEEIIEIKFDSESDCINAIYDIYSCGDDPDETELEDLEDVKIFLNNEMGGDYSLNYFEKCDKIYPDTMFLTQKEAENHLRANHYHYSKDAHTYAMTAWRAPDVERLWKILQEVDWERLEDLIGKDKPMETGEPEIDIFRKSITPCGSCGEEINTMWGYCPWCGQGIGGKGEKND